MTQEQRPTKLKLILDKRRMSQSELYDKIKSSCKSYLGKDVISMIVNGKKKNYEIYTLLKLCVALNVTPNELIEKDDFIETQLK
jgi:DNA-binding Xre family transcriptional regulator